MLTTRQPRGTHNNFSVTHSEEERNLVAWWLRVFKNRRLGLFCGSGPGSFFLLFNPPVTLSAFSNESV